MQRSLSFLMMSSLFSMIIDCNASESPIGLGACFDSVDVKWLMCNMSLVECGPKGWCSRVQKYVILNM